MWNNIKPNVDIFIIHFLILVYFNQKFYSFAVFFPTLGDFAPLCAMCHAKNRGVMTQITLGPPPAAVIVADRIILYGWRVLEHGWLFSTPLRHESKAQNWTLICLQDSMYDIIIITVNKYVRIQIFHKFKFCLLNKKL